MFKCSKCGKSHTRLPGENVKRGMQYVIMFDCNKCGQTIGIEGVKGKAMKVMR